MDLNNTSYNMGSMYNIEDKHEDKHEKYEIKEYFDFEDMGLKENLLRGIYAYGFEKPSPIQTKGIMPIIDGKYVIAQSQSGTGKTATFTIGMLQRIDDNIKEPQAIVVANTRELANQIVYVTEALSLYMKEVKVSVCIGGTDTGKSIKDLQGSQIIVGTPGRINMLIKNNKLNTNYLKLLIVDEADELLSNSFIPQLKEMVESIPEESQICLFSATMQNKIGITKKFMVDPVYILVNKDQLTLDGIRQFYISIPEENWKFDTLCDLYNMISISQSIIYVNGKKKADWLQQELEKKDFMVSVIHSDMSMVERTQVINDFRKGKIRILIATDLIARGIDIQQVSIVLNYDVPMDKESYIHRIGRSGRFGRKGVAINFATKREEKQLDEIKMFYHTQIEQMPENIEELL